MRKRAWHCRVPILVTYDSTTLGFAQFYYLAVTARPHTRESPAGLLWGDMPEAHASKNLRNALANLRSLVGPYLIISRDEVVKRSSIKPQERVTGNERPVFKPRMASCQRGFMAKGAEADASSLEGSSPMFWLWAR